MEPMECDPDYKSFNDEVYNDHVSEETTLLEKNVRLDSINTIEQIIGQQFGDELEAKEKEVFDTHQRLTKVRSMLDRLRACTVASYYAKSFTTPMADNKAPLSGTSNHPAIKNVMRSAVTSVMSKNSSYTQPSNQAVETSTAMEVETNEIETPLKDTVSMTTDDTPAPPTPQPKPIVHRPRHRIKKTVIVGNISKYIPPEKREGADKSTHKWMVYVRGDKEEPRIDHFIKKVWFFLHPSYRPNDLVEVHDPPFHLTRRGWGEFPIRVQLHFCDPRNKPVDILHNLKLDRTYTGLQTLGMETVCEIELDETSFEPRVEDLLQNSELVKQPIPDVTEPEDHEKSKASCKLNFGSVDEVKTEPEIPPQINDDKEKVETVEQKTKAGALTNGVHCDVTIPPVVRSTRKRRKTVECIIPIKRCNIEDFHNGVAETNGVEHNETTIEEKTKIENNSPEKTNSVSSCKNNDEASVDGSHAVSPNSVILSKCTGQFHKVYLGDKTKGTFINFLPTPPKTLSNQKQEPDILPKLAAGKCLTNCDKTVINILSDTSKLNGTQQSPQKFVLLGNGQAKLLTNNNASPNSAKNPVRILPSNKNIVINVKNIRANNIEKRRSLSLDGSPQSPAYLATTLISPDKVSVMKQTVRKEPVHVIVNANMDNSQKLQIPCRLKQTSQGFIVITDTKDKISPKVPYSKNLLGNEAHPISVQNLQSLLNGGKSIKNITFHKGSDDKPSNQSLQKCVVAQLTNFQGKQHVTLVNKQSNIKLSDVHGNAKTFNNNADPHCINNQQNQGLKRSRTKETSVSPPPLPLHKVIGNQIYHTHLRSFSDALWVVVPRVCLVANTQNKFEFPCANSNEEFLMWNVGKRRAAEVQRATLVQNILRYIQSKSTLLKSQKMPSKRYIAKWCLLHGFSVLRDAADEGSSNTYLEDSATNEPETSCSEPSQLLATLSKSNTCKEVCSESDDEIDIVSVSPKKQCSNQPSMEYCHVDNVPATCRNQLPFIPHIVKQIGVKLDEPSPEDGVPLTNVLFTKAMELFIKHIKSESHAQAITSRTPSGSYPTSTQLVSVKDVASSLCNVSEFDIFTDKYLAMKYE